MRVRICKDCKAEGRTGPPLNAPHPGPRCYRHHKAHQRAVRDRVAEYRHRTMYELPPGAYGDLLAAQGGCGVCGRNGGKRRLAVDHDHSCCPGKNSCGECVRGLLCWSCNKFLQHIGDDPQTVARMLDYLQNPPARTVVLNQTHV